MSLDEFRKEMLPAVEEELKAAVRLADGEGLKELHHMLSYHLGWQGKDVGPKASGKRVRPLLVLLSAAAAGGDWAKALPAAAAVELLHNFSLIHDDIQDNSELRRGRSTLWAKWGVAQAINAGDAMFALAHIVLGRLKELTSPEVYIQAARLLPRASLQLTQGQYLDLAYEEVQDLTLESYWPMVQGKTAVLLATCTQLGALAGGAVGESLEAYTRFGEKLGLAFQVYDDLLGIWGNEKQTGKSSVSDLLSEKKSLPVLYALNKGGDFAQVWQKNELRSTQLDELTGLLESEGGRAYAEEQAARLTGEALDALTQAQANSKAGSALREIARELVERES